MENRDYHDDAFNNEGIKKLEDLLSSDCEKYKGRSSRLERMADLLELTLSYIKDEQFEKAFDTSKLTKSAMEEEFGKDSPVCVLIAMLQGYIYDRLGDEQKSEEMDRKIIDMTHSRDLDELITKLHGVKAAFMIGKAMLQTELNSKKH